MNRLALSLACLVAFQPLAHAAERPMVLVHSGFLLDGSDQPVTEPQEAMTFRIFDQNAPVNTENKLWEATCTVNVDHGHYAVGLGGDCGSGLTPSILPTDVPRYLEVSVGTTQLLPRMLIGTVPNAAVASDALALDGEALSDLDQRYARLGGAPADGPQAGHIAIDGEVSAKSLATTGDATVGGALSGASLSTTGDATVGGALGATGALSGASLATTGDAQIGGGLTVGAGARFQGGVEAAAFVGDGSKVTALDAGNLATGTLPDGRLAGPQSAAVRFSNASNSFTGTFTGTGAGLTALDASNVAAGTLADARLPADVPRLASNNAFTGTNTFAGQVGVGTASPQATLDVKGSIRGDVGGATVAFDFYDYKTHALGSTTMGVEQALCTVRHGLWDAPSGRCQSPLAYGTSTLNRQAADAAALATCPTGYTPADCNTAMFLEQFWRLNPNGEAPNGDAWCAGTVDGSLDSDLGKRGLPGMWHAAGTNGTVVCSPGTALVVDQCTPEENGCVGRASPFRPHLYCRSETDADVWMCVATNLP